MNFKNSWRNIPISVKEYNQIHAWIRYRYGKAKDCIGNSLGLDCAGHPQCQWALVRDKKYKKDIKHFIPLCRSCHAKYDATDKAKERMYYSCRFVQRTACGRGHEYNDVNTRYYHNPEGKIFRVCKQCQKIHDAKSRAKRKALSLKYM